MQCILSFQKMVFIFSFFCNRFFFSSVQAQNNKPVKSQWAYLNSNGKLNYKTLPQGDRIMDFSYAGYMGGGVKIPLVDVKITVSPTAGDNSEAIQNAIDKVSEMPLIKWVSGSRVIESREL